MKVKLNKLMAGPGGCFPPGSVLEIDDETAAILVSDGAEIIAELTPKLDPESEPGHETEPEPITEPEPEPEPVSDSKPEFEPEREEAAVNELETDHATVKRTGVRGRRPGAGKG